ncbi:sugar ABC transporter permease [Streptomyces sp. NBC_01224]|uniref:sugar ABC transporter permease n=1 Tax=Streptomyces sp. NBC_01224 TaxID=2903783 RepID=UPI002E11A6B4|nr:sugar ABC transporter permease [Streptomyces sp. NBC_01224]
MTVAGDWPERALADILHRVDVTRAEVGARFPLFADPDTGRWETTGRGSWTGGFWAGLLWLRARYTGHEADRAVASACTARLAGWVEADTATRGLILWYGTALAVNDRSAEELRNRAARACLAALEPELCLVPWGSAFGGPRLLARVDGVPGTVPLLASAGVEGAAAAASHLHRHIDLCRVDGSVVPALRFEPDTGWQPCDDPPPGWSRGRPWLLLAVADALHQPRTTQWNHQRLEATAAGLVAARTGLPRWGVPPADEGQPDGPQDTSAAAITAVALLKLACVPGPRAAEHSSRALAILDHLVASHLTGPMGARPAGMLLNGCYDAGRSVAVRHELIWGDFFLALGLAALTGLIDIRTV